MPRHYAKYNNEEYIVLGHNPKYNNCMLVRMVALPIEEQADLRSIAMSEVAQRYHYYLMPVLMTQQHRSGKAWNEYLVEQGNRRGGAVITLPLKDIQDSIDPEQKAVWKGYGKPNPGPRPLNPSAQLSADSRALQETYHPGSTHPVGQQVSPPMIPPEVLGSVVPADDDYTGDTSPQPSKLDRLADLIAEQNRQTQDGFNKLAEILAALVPAKASAEDSSERPKRRQTGEAK